MTIIVQNFFNIKQLANTKRVTDMRVQERIGYLRFLQLSITYNRVDTEILKKWSNYPLE